jgi:hypothetical protein
MAGFDRDPAERNRHGLADPGRSHEQDVGGVVKEAESGQVADELLVDTGLGDEVVCAAAGVRYFRAAGFRADSAVSGPAVCLVGGESSADVVAGGQATAL